MRGVGLRQGWGPLLLSMLLGLCECGSQKPLTAYPELSIEVVRGNPPESLAVLPFHNQTGTPDIEKLVRESFYGHLSVRPYRDVELSEVDRLLSEYAQRTKREPRELTPRELGRLLDCEAIILGEMTEFRMIFAGIYSQIAVGAAISIWDTGSGRMIWRDQHVARFHEGGLPLSPFSVPLISLRSGWNLRSIMRIRAIHELSRYLARRIPYPEAPRPGSDDGHPVHYEIQTGAFLDEDRAVRLTAALRAGGYPAFIQRNRDDRGLWHRVLLGPFEDSEEAMRLRKEIHERLGASAFIVPVPLEERNREKPRR